MWLWCETGVKQSLAHQARTGWIVTAASDSGLVDIHDRRPVVLPPSAAREWMNPATSPERAKEIALEALTPAEEYDWHPVTKKVGNIRNNAPELIKPLDAVSINIHQQ